MLCSNDGELIRNARFLSQQARDPAPHYEHSVVGFNYRMSSLSAAMGLAQLEVLDDRVKARRAIFDAYSNRLADLPGLTFMPETPLGSTNRWLTVILIDPAGFGATREDVRVALETSNIESRPVWKPLHRQRSFHGSRFRGGNVADLLFERGLCLPSGSALTQDQIDRVTDIIRQTCRGASHNRCRVPARAA